MNSQISLGAELKRYEVPQKYCSKSGIIGDILPTAVIFLLVELYSGTLMSDAFGAVISIVISFVIYIAFMLFFIFMFGAMKKRLAKTCISICERGICGVRQAGFSVAEYRIPYGNIKNVSGKKENLRLVTKTNDSFFHYVSDASEAARIIESKRQSV